ncbi:MAG: M12 family metallo-peptidase [Planctomycetota bacterium]
MRRRSFTAILVAAVAIATGSKASAQPTAPVPASILQGLDLTGGSLQTLSFSEHPDSGTLYTSIDVDGATWNLELQRYSMRADDFQVLIDDGSGDLVPHPAPPIVTWRGTVLEVPGSRVRAYYDNGVLRGTILTDTETVAVQPATDAGQAAPALQHVVYTGIDLAPLNVQCGVTHTNRLQGYQPNGSGAAPFGPNVKVCDISLDADNAYYQINGNNVTTTVNDIEVVMNSVESVYEVPAIGITYEIGTIIVRTVSGTYTTSSAGGLLNQFEGVWNTSPETFIVSDVAHLFTGKNINGSTIGIAALGRICSATEQYGLSQSRFTTNFSRRVALTAHELGHNWAAFHCDGASTCRIMCSGLGGCTGLSPLTFGTNAVNSIVNHKNSRACLENAQPALPIPFTDDFAGGIVNLFKWTFRRGALISSDASSEPSGTTSLNLDTSGSQLYRDDEIRSVELLLQGTINTQLTYFTQHVGVESGEELVVDYLSSQLHWVELNRITSDGNDQTAFVAHNHTLPASALHNQFRVRFRTEGNSPTDDWYIDDVTISEGPIVQDPPELTSISPNRGNENGGQTVTIIGDKFNQDAVVFVGATPLNDLQFVSQTQIIGVTPPGFSGMFDVSIAQTSGSDALTDVYEYVVAVLHVESTPLVVGSTANAVDVRGDNSFDVSAFSFGIDYDSTLISVDDVTVVGTAAELATTFGFVQQMIDTNPEPAGGFMTLAVLMDTSPPFFAVIPAGSNNVLARMEVSVAPTAVVGTDLALEVKNTLGLPPVDVTFATATGLAVSIVPDVINGTIDFVDTPLFLRGDANDDGGVDVADAVRILAYLFSSGSVNCLVSLDANDDEGVDIADAVRVLAYLFSGGMAPPEPFPGPGLDPTPGALLCLPAP